MSVALSPDSTAYGLTGPKGAPVVALIHGLGLCREMWEGHRPAFAARYRVLDYDLYGHGGSAPPPETASLRLYANQLVGLLDHLGIAQAAVVGFSIGGMINRRFALDHPERLSVLAVLNSPHDRGEMAQAEVEARAGKVRAEGPMATLDPALKRWFTPAFRAGNPAAMDRVRAWRRAVDPESYAQAAWVLANGVRELVRPDPALTVPSLVMTAEADAGSTPAMSHAIAAEIPGAETIIVPGLQHMGLMETPEAFTAPILDFLDRRLP